MDNYFRIYMQMEKDGSEVKDTIPSFGMYCMTNPFMTCSEVKEPTKRSWHDEDGDDEYVNPDSGLRMSSYEKEIRFGFKGTSDGARENLKAFLSYLRGGLMKVYCEYNKTGRQHVRLKKVAPNLVQSADDESVLTVTLTFKYNDPVTDIVPKRDVKNNVTSLEQA